MTAHSADTLIALVNRAPNAPLFTTQAGSITAARFLADASRCAAQIPDGEHVVNCCQNRYWFAVAFAATLLRGQISLLTGNQSPASLATLGRRFASLHVLADDLNFASPVPLCLIGPGPCIVSPPAAIPLMPASRIVAIVFTSGSTGEPSATAKSFGELVARSEAAAERFGFTVSDPATIIGTVPPNHMYGFETTILLPLHAPVASWCDPVFYPADLHAALACVPGRSVLVTTPLHLRGLLHTRLSPPPTLVVSATAPLDLDLAAAVEQSWGTEVMEIFGASEIGSLASRRTTADPTWSVYPGLCLSGEDGPVVTAPHAPPRLLNDVIQFLDHGRSFRLVGRCGDMVKLGGHRASLAGLTHVLNGLEGVQDGVFLTPDDMDRPNARLLALVVAPGRSREDILVALRGRIDPVFLPRPLVCVAALPRSALGKLARTDLLALAAQAQPPAHRAAE